MKEANKILPIWIYRLYLDPSISDKVREKLLLQEMKYL